MLLLAPQPLQECQYRHEHIHLQSFHKRDRLTDFFDELKERCEFDKWYFGHYHKNQVIAGEYIALYKDIIEIGNANGTNPAIAAGKVIKSKIQCIKGSVNPNDPAIIAAKFSTIPSIGITHAIIPFQRLWE